MGKLFVLDPTGQKNFFIIFNWCYLLIRCRVEIYRFAIPVTVFVIQRTEVSFFLFQTINYGCIFLKGKLTLNLLLLLEMNLW